MWEILIEYHKLFLQGFVTTLELLGLIVIIGIPFGIVVGAIGARFSKTVAKLVEGLKFFTKVVPVLIFLFWLHYPLQAMLGVVIEPFWTAVFALGFINLVATAHVIQSELELLPNSYSDAGKTLGLSKWQVVKHIEIPIILRRVVPTLLLIQAAMLEYTLLASLISVQELFRVAQSINSMIYDPVSIYTIIVLFFMVILIPLHLLIGYLSKRYKIQYA